MTVREFIAGKPRIDQNGLSVRQYDLKIASDIKRSDPDVRYSHDLPPVRMKTLSLLKP
jgi:hypothetical protein